MKKTLVALAALGAAGAMSTPAFSAEPIVGKWRAPGGGVVRVAPCGGAYCATVITGENKGKAVGQMTGSGGEYAGTVTDPRDNRTYSGTASVGPSQLKLTGCALRVFCKTQTWVRM
ncbi:DUF2147 domain-containing protein [Jiella sp. M17.18]|uniref:DUF2147 domain-containing protein n=1 Tax=Jiella sp. M17.18 TaxID=3234247 RepID=UPI0034DE96E4